jgi:hypothetical protein
MEEHMYVVSGKIMAVADTRDHGIFYWLYLSPFGSAGVYSPRKIFPLGQQLQCMLSHSLCHHEWEQQ